MFVGENCYDRNVAGKIREYKDQIICNGIFNKLLFFIQILLLQFVSLRSFDSHRFTNPLNEVSKILLLFGFKPLLSLMLQLIHFTPILFHADSWRLVRVLHGCGCVFVRCGGAYW